MLVRLDPEDKLHKTTPANHLQSLPRGKSPFLRYQYTRIDQRMLHIYLKQRLGVWPLPNSHFVSWEFGNEYLSHLYHSSNHISWLLLLVCIPPLPPLSVAALSSTRQVTWLDEWSWLTLPILQCTVTCPTSLRTGIYKIATMQYTPGVTRKIR